VTVSSKPEHTPVFLDQILTIAQQLNQPLSRVRTMFDGTFGRGGHTRALLNLFTEATLLARDWDADAIQAAEISFANELQSGRLKLERASFSEPFRDQQSETFDLMLLDLGVSSPQLDRAERGFSFYHDGPLDMRMDQRREFSACDIVNTWSEQDLDRLII
jgi:16S rRNA (cytosine1402-N4)-methyltransferase